MYYICTMYENPGGHGPPDPGADAHMVNSGGLWLKTWGVLQLLRESKKRITKIYNVITRILLKLNLYEN